MNDQLDTILYQIRSLHRKVTLIAARREKATQRQARERVRHPIYLKAVDFLKAEDNHHAPVVELRRYLQQFYHRKAVYRFMRRLHNNAYHPKMTVNAGETFYDSQT